MRYIISLLLTSTAALAEVPQVVADIPPVHSIVAAVMGDLGQPALLLERGASEHHFQLRPSQAAGIAGAGLVVMVSPRLTPWLDHAVAGRPAGTPVLVLLDAPGTRLEDYDDHDDHGHGHDSIDPHAWLDPRNGTLWAGAVAAELSRLDPANAATYAANAAALTARIEAVDAANRALLAPLKDRGFATAHAALGYFAERYDLEDEGALAPGDATAPGARHLSELREEIAEGDVVCLFPEAGHDPALLAQLAEGTAVRIGAALDPVGTAMEPGPELYPALLEGIGKTLADCLR